MYKRQGKRSLTPFLDYFMFDYCPKCKEEIETKEDGYVYECGHCDFLFYNNPAPATAVILENDKGEIMFVRRANEPQKGLLDLPGGFVDPGERAEDGAIRELKEELGIDEDLDLKFVTSWANDYPYKGINYKVLDLVFHAKIKQTDFDLDTSENSELVWIAKDKVPIGELAFYSHKKVFQKLF